ncbi:hypothetical protein ACFS07_11265 [Undibacterium arcticum]
MTAIRQTVFSYNEERPHDALESLPQCYIANSCSHGKKFYFFEIDLTGRRAEKRGAIAGDIQPRRPSLAIACGNLTAIKACIWQMI